MTYSDPECAARSAGNGSAGCDQDPRGSSAREREVATTGIHRAPSTLTPVPLEPGGPPCGWIGRGGADSGVDDGAVSGVYDGAAGRWHERLGTCWGYHGQYFHGPRFLWSCCADWALGEMRVLLLLLLLLRFSPNLLY
eukprot:COSAG05_NODE_7489_length_804_cov_1.822695_1_plen_138_part_00